MKRILFGLLATCFFRIGLTQSIIVNTPDSIFYLNQGTLCGFSWAGAYCGQATTRVFSTAIHKDTIFILANNSSLFRMKLGDPGTCTLLTTFPINDPWGLGRTTINSMTTDKNGIIYTADGESRDIIRYNPHTNVKEFLGKMNVHPGGDLIFYKNKLLLATSGFGIYEMDLSNPPASQQFMETSGYVFYGLVSVPFDCSTNKYYGLDVLADRTRLVELDLENKQIGSVFCELRKTIYDAATNVDDGNTIGVTIDSIRVQAACEDETLASVQVVAHSATSGSLTYELNGAESNNNGLFTGLPEGTHSIKVTNPINCELDSVFMILHGMSPVTISKVDPLNCDQPNGMISVTANSGYGPLRYKIGQRSFQSSPVFDNLPAGAHLVTIADAAGCVKDTTVYLNYQERPTYFSGFLVQPTVCDARNGSITISFPATTNPADLTMAVNDGPAMPASMMGSLDAGAYRISLFYKNGCRFDTLVHVEKLYNPRPSIDLAVTDQQCLVNNGLVHISVAGALGPYTVDFNRGGFSSSLTYPNLETGIYSITIRDNGTCTFDTLAEVKPYLATPVASTLLAKDPTCTKPNGGEITVDVTGSQDPYLVKIGSELYPAGTKFINLFKGEYIVSILNRDHCVIDTLHVKLDLKWEPECDFVFVPTAFSPNDDGLNDFISPYIGEGLGEFRFSVYNRWGQLLYTTSEKGAGWDGRMGGRRQPLGVYTWFLAYKTQSDTKPKMVKGTLTLLR